MSEELSDEQLGVIADRPWLAYKRDTRALVSEYRRLLAAERRVRTAAVDMIQRPTGLVRSDAVAAILLAALEGDE